MSFKLDDAILEKVIAERKQSQTYSAPIIDSTAIPQPEENIPSVSMLESILRGGAQGATLGYADELTGGAQALSDIALDNDKSLSDLPNLYRQHRDESRKAYAAAQEANPKAYLASEVGGGLASTLVPIGTVAQGSLATIKGAAALGAVGGIGAAEGDLTTGNILPVAEGALVGAAGGAVGQKLGQVAAESSLGKKAGEYISKTLENKADKLDKSSSAQVVKLLGGSKGEAKNILGKEGTNTDFGKTIVESGALPITGDAFALENAAEKAIESKNKTSSGLIDDVQKMIEKADPEKKTLADNGFLSDIQKIINDSYELESKTNGAEAARSVSKSLLNRAQGILNSADDPKELLNLRQLYAQKMSDASKSALQQGSEEQKQYKMMYDLINNRIQDLGQLVEGDIGNKFRRTQFDISNLIKAKQMAIAKQSEGSKLFKPTLADTLLGGAVGTITHSPAMGLAAIAAKKGIESGLGDTLGNVAQRVAVRGKFKVSDRFRDIASDVPTEVFERGAAASVGTIAGDQIASDDSTNKVHSSVYLDKAKKLDGSNPTDAKLKKMMLEAAEDPAKEPVLLFEVKSNPVLRERYNAL